MNEIFNFDREHEIKKESFFKTIKYVKIKNILIYNIV